MTTRRPFTQVDVFTEVAMRGNALAVVHEADGLSDAQMQDFARWMNLSETAFLLRPTKPGADYRVRIFTPMRELPFAGHPTLGSCHAWLERGGRAQAEGHVVQECAVGLVRIRRDGARLAFAAPPLIKTGAVEPAVLGQIGRSLRIDASAIRASQWVDNGPGWVAVMLGSRDDVLALKPDFAAMEGLEVGVVGPWQGGDAQFEVRAFIPNLPGYEDPVTGSLNAGLAQWLIGAGIAPERYVASQGRALGRAGRVHVQREGETIWVGGASVSCVRGDVTL